MRNGGFSIVKEFDVHMNKVDGFLKVEFSSNFGDYRLAKEQKKSDYLRLHVKLLYGENGKETPVILGQASAYVFNTLYSDKDFLAIADSIDPEVYKMVKHARNEMYDFDMYNHIVVLDSIEINGPFRKQGMATYLLKDIQEYVYKVLQAQAILINASTIDKEIITTKRLQAFYSTNGFDKYAKNYMVNRMKYYDDELQLRHLVNTIQSVDPDLAPLVDGAQNVGLMTPNTQFENRQGEYFYAAYLEQGLVITSDTLMDNNDQAIILNEEEIEEILKVASTVRPGPGMEIEIDNIPFYEEEVYWVVSVMLAYLNQIQFKRTLN